MGLRISDDAVIADPPREATPFGEMNGEFYIDSPHADKLVEALTEGRSVTIDFVDDRGVEYDQSETIPGDGFASMLIQLLHQAPLYHNYNQSNLCSDDAG